MKVHVHRDPPEPWPAKRGRVRHRWLLPFWAVEWALEWVAFALSRWTFLAVLEYLEGFSVLIAVIFYFSESGDRLKQKHYQAWQVINTAQGKGGNGGRIDALEELNSDGVSLIGVDLSGAFLQDLHLQRARLSRASFSAADLRSSDLSSADLSDANLQSANLRQSNLRNASFQRAALEDADLTDADLTGADFTAANLENCDLTDADLTNVRWRGLSNIRGANIFGIRNAPQDFASWATQHGAISTKPGER